MVQPEMPSIGCVIAFGVIATAAPAHAHSEPAIAATWSIGTDEPAGGDIVLELDVGDDGQTIFCGVVEVEQGLIEMEVSMALPPALTVAVFAQNLSSETGTFAISIDLSTYTYPESTLVGGSIIGSVTGGDGVGILDLADDAPFFTALIDDASVGELITELPEPIVAEPWATAVIGPASFGDPIPSAPAPPVGYEVGLKLKFQLSPGGLLVATGIFAYEPILCTADLDGNGAVDGGDLGLLLADWGGPGAGDLNADGVVDGADLGQFLAGWGACGD